MGCVGSLHSPSPRGGTQTSGSSPTAYKSMGLVSGEAQDRARARQVAQAAMYRNFLVTWVGYPVLVWGCSLFGAPLAPTCESGFSKWSLVFLALGEAHHWYCEYRAWYAVRSTFAPPELTIMRQTGVLARRRTLLLLGFLQSASLYMELLFPFVVRSCEGSRDMVDFIWLEGWDDVPFAGQMIATITQRLRFSGLALLFKAVSVAVFLVSISSSSLSRPHSQQTSKQALATESDDERLFEREPTDSFFAWQALGAASHMPSVAMLCEAMTTQRRFTYDPSKVAKDATEARANAIFRKISGERARSFELSDQREQERVDEEVQHVHARHLLLKVFFGTVLTLWLQGSFFELSFGEFETPAVAKLMVSMALSSLLSLREVLNMATRTNKASVCLMLAVVLFFVAWGGLKVAFGFICESHRWNIFNILKGQQGCVDLKGLQ